MPSPDAYTQVTARVDFSGPFFSRDPGRTVRGNLTAMLEEMADLMEQDVRGQIEARAGSMPRYSGWTADHVVGRVENYAGRKWRLHAVVSANTEGMEKREAIRTKAAAATIERRWHPFRRTTTAVRKVAKNLAAGLE